MALENQSVNDSASGTEFKHFQVTETDNFNNVEPALNLLRLSESPNIESDKVHVHQGQTTFESTDRLNSSSYIEFANNIYPTGQKFLDTVLPLTEALVPVASEVLKTVFGEQESKKIVDVLDSLPQLLNVKVPESFSFQAVLKNSALDIQLGKDNELKVRGDFAGMLDGVHGLQQNDSTKKLREFLSNLSEFTMKGEQVTLKLKENKEVAIERTLLQYPFIRGLKLGNDKQEIKLNIKEDKSDPSKFTLDNIEGLNVVSRLSLWEMPVTRVQVNAAKDKPSISYKVHVANWYGDIEKSKELVKADGTPNPGDENLVKALRFHGELRRAIESRDFKKIYNILPVSDILKTAKDIEIRNFKMNK